MSPAATLEYMKELRIALELSQKEWALAVGVGKEAVAQYETGRTPWRDHVVRDANRRVRLWLTERFIRQMVAIERSSLPEREP